MGDAEGTMEGGSSNGLGSAPSLDGVWGGVGHVGLGRPEDGESYPALDSLRLVCVLANVSRKIVGIPPDTARLQRRNSVLVWLAKALGVGSQRSVERRRRLGPRQALTLRGKNDLGHPQWRE